MRMNSGKTGLIDAKFEVIHAQLRSLGHLVHRYTTGLSDVLTTQITADITKNLSSSLPVALAEKFQGILTAGLNDEIANKFKQIKTETTHAVATELLKFENALTERYRLVAATPQQYAEIAAEKRKEQQSAAVAAKEVEDELAKKVEAKRLKREQREQKRLEIEKRKKELQATTEAAARKAKELQEAQKETERLRVQKARLEEEYAKHAEMDVTDSSDESTVVTLPVATILAGTQEAPESYKLGTGTYPAVTIAALAPITPPPEVLDPTAHFRVQGREGIFALCNIGA